MALALVDRAPEEAAGLLAQAVAGYEALERAGKLTEHGKPLLPELQQLLATYRRTGRFPPTPAPAAPH